MQSVKEKIKDKWNKLSKAGKMFICIFSLILVFAIITNIF